MRFRKMFGIFLMIVSSILILYQIFSQILEIRILTRGYGYEDYFFEILTEGIFPSIIFFIFGFLPGKYYYKLGEVESKLIDWAVILGTLGAIIFLPAIFLLLRCFISGTTQACDMFAFGAPFILFGFPALIIYSISILLTTIYWFKNRE